MQNKLIISNEFIQNNISSFFGLTLGVVINVIYLFGSSELTQGIIYFLYLLGIFYIIIFSIKVEFSKKFITTLTTFLSLWIIAFFINFNSNHIESSLIRLDIFIYHFFMVTLLISMLYLWQRDRNNNNISFFFKSLFISLTPISFFVFFSICYQFFINSGVTPVGLNYRHLDSEFFLIWLFSIFFIRHLLIKFSIILLCLFVFLILDVRGALLSSFIFIFFAFLLPYIMNISIKKISIIIFILGILFFFSYNYIYDFFNSFLYFESISRGYDSGLTNRIPVWITAIENIKAHPWTGIGYYVRPNPFYEPNNPGLNVHNYFLRIWVENGTPVFFYVCIILLLTIINIEKNKLYWDRAVFWSILFYYFFVPRHIQLNPMSFILYLVIIRSFLLNGNSSKHLE